MAVHRQFIGALPCRGMRLVRVKAMGTLYQRASEVALYGKSQSSLPAIQSKQKKVMSHRQNRPFGINEKLRTVFGSRGDMTLSEYQKELRNSYYGGGIGAIVSGLVWATAAYVAEKSGIKTGFITLFFGGMLIFPVSLVVVSSVLRQPGPSKGNPGGRMVVETLPGMLLGLFLAFLFLEINPQMVFPIAALAVGAHYFSFRSAYGDFTYWVLGGAMMAIGYVGLIGMLADFPLSVAALIAITEIVFGLLITARSLAEQK